MPDRVAPSAWKSFGKSALVFIALVGLIAAYLTADSLDVRWVFFAAAIPAAAWGFVYYLGPRLWNAWNENKQLRRDGRALQAVLTERDAATGDLRLLRQNASASEEAAILIGRRIAAGEMLASAWSRLWGQLSVTSVAFHVDDMFVAAKYAEAPPPPGSAFVLKVAGVPQGLAYVFVNDESHANGLVTLQTLRTLSEPGTASIRLLGETGVPNPGSYQLIAREFENPSDLLEDPR